MRAVIGARRAGPGSVMVRAAVRVIHMHEAIAGRRGNAAGRWYREITEIPWAVRTGGGPRREGHLRRWYLRLRITGPNRPVVTVLKGR